MRLHEARSVQFCFVPFDEEKDISSFPSFLLTTIMRMVATAVFAGMLIINFNLTIQYNCHDITEETSQHHTNAFYCSLPLRAGFATLIDYSTNLNLWLALMTSSYLFLVAINMYITLHRYV